MKNNFDIQNDIDVYEFDSDFVIRKICNDLNDCIKGNSDSELYLEIPYGFALFLNHYLGHQSIKYPIVYSSPSELNFITLCGNYIPLKIINSQCLALKNVKNEVLYCEILEKYRTRYNKIYVHLKEKEIIPDDLLEAYLNATGLKFYKRINENTLEVSLVDKFKLKDSTKYLNFELELIDTIFIR